MACLSSVQATPPVSEASALLVPHFPCSRSGECVPCLPGWSLTCSRLRPSCRLSVPLPQPSPNPPQKAPGERGLPEQRQPSLVPERPPWGLRGVSARTAARRSVPARRRAWAGLEGVS